MIATMLFFLAAAVIKIIKTDLSKLFKKNKKDFYIVGSVALFGIVLFFLHIFGAKIYSPLEILSDLMQKAKISYKP